MQKIPTVFVRNENDRRFVIDQVPPGCEWALNGKGQATRKYDGTCVMFDGEKWWARREVKVGKEPPADWIFLSVDDATGKSMGWEPIEQSPFAKFHQEAIEESGSWPVGTYELIGPKINGDPEKSGTHLLVFHKGAERLKLLYPETFADLRFVMAELRECGYEGIVWHHPDGRLAKLKVKDFEL